MPIYEFCCEACDERFELFVRSAAQGAEPICPRCGSSKARKAISLFGIGEAGKGGETGAVSCGPSPT